MDDQFKTGPEAAPCAVGGGASCAPACRAAEPGATIASMATSRDAVSLIGGDGFVEAVNPTGLDLMRQGSLDSVFASRWETAWPEKDRAAAREALARASAGQDVVFQGFRSTDGGPAHLWETHLFPVADETGTVRRVVSVARDETARGRRERALTASVKRQREALLSLSAEFEENCRRLREAEARVSHEDRLRLFGRFVGGVVHDFNNVFAAVSGAAKLLRRNLADGPALETVGHVERAADRGAALARQLLDFARGDSDAAEVFDPAALLLRDRHLLRHVVGGAATLSVETEPGAWRVLGSPQKFQSVLFNLVANARDAIGADGRIDVAVSNCPSRSRPPMLDVDDYVVLSVSDNGPGMSREALRRAGEPFFTTKAAGIGTGLGLASAFELAAACGGRAFVENRQQAGAQVRVFLRRAIAEGQARAISRAVRDDVNSPGVAR